MKNIYISYLITGNSKKSEELTWGSHVNKSFLQIIDTVYQKDKDLLESQIMISLDPSSVSGNTFFMYPFGICVNYVDYNPEKEFSVPLFNDNYYEFENIFVFITDPAMLTYSSIDQLSHQGTKIFGLKVGYSTFYDVEVEIKDFDNPSERDSCSLSSYADCVDKNTQEIFSKVISRCFISCYS